MAPLPPRKFKRLFSEFVQSDASQGEVDRAGDLLFCAPRQARAIVANWDPAPCAYVDSGGDGRCAQTKKLMAECALQNSDMARQSAGGKQNDRLAQEQVIRESPQQR